MAQAEALITTLKKALKNSGLTYADVARHLGMSEANVKRLFSSKRFTIERLEDICQLMNMELSDLFHLHEETRTQITQLTLEQEKTLVQDIKLLLVAVSVRNRLTFDDMIKNYELSETELVRCLAALDKLKIIDLLPQNRFKLLIDDNFRWHPNGPIERFFETQIQGQFLKSSFCGEMEQRLFLFGLLGESSTQLLIKRMQAFAQEFTDLYHQDNDLPLEKRHTIGLMLAMRPWNAEVFTPLTKSDSKIYINNAKKKYK